MLDNDKLTRENLLNDLKLRRIATEAGGYAGAFYIHEHKLYVSTNHKFSDMIKFIERLLEFSNTEHTEIKVAFRE